MSTADWTPSDGRDFDALLRDSLPELPPENVVKTVTPWRKAMDRVLAGMALSTLTLNFWCLSDILPAVGAVLMLLGFRTLRRENGWFRICWAAAVLRLLLLVPALIVNATIWKDAVSSGAGAMQLVGAALCLCQAFALWRGFAAVQRRAGVAVHAGAAAALLVWLAVIGLLTAVSYEGTPLMLGMIAVYALILYSMFRMSRELDEAGYAVKAAPIRVPDWAVAAMVAAVLAAGIACAYLFLERYPMQWAELPAASDSLAAETRGQLAGLGFPDAVLDDLTDEDVLACKGAAQVVVSTRDHFFESWDNVQPARSENEAQQTADIRITDVAVKLPDGGQWKIFHHFLWLTSPGVRGTECLQLWPAYRTDAGWADTGQAVTGRVLYSDGGTVYAAPYYSLDSAACRSVCGFAGIGDAAGVIAEFSLPAAGTDLRGYVSYTAEEQEGALSLYSQISYTHQWSRLQYPVLTAGEQRETDPMGLSKTFRTVQDVLQFLVA